MSSDTLLMPPMGGVFVLRRENDRTRIDRFVPAALALESEFTNVISVGAQTHGNQASYSNYGMVLGMGTRVMPM